jgi:predicted transcriptional regulator
MHQRPGDDLEMIVRHINELSENLVVVAKNDLETLAKIKSSVAKLSGDQNEKELLLATVDDLANSISERIAEPKGLRNQNA